MERGLATSSTPTAALGAGVFAEPPAPSETIRDGRSATPRAAKKTGAVGAEAPGVLLESVIGLLLLVSLAGVMAHPKVREVEVTLGIADLVATGLPFLLLGWAARLPAVGLLDDALLARLAPVVDFCLGWLGLWVGLRFDLRLKGWSPAGAGGAVAIWAGLPFIALTLLGGAGLWLLQPELALETAALDALLIGAAGAMTGHLTGTLGDDEAVASAGSGDRQRLEPRVAQGSALIGIVSLALLSAVVRPTGASSWQMPWAAWLCVWIGVSVALGLLVYTVARRPTTDAEFLAVIIGSVAFSSGFADFLHLPPLAVCFLIGVTLSHLPGELRRRATPILRQLERPLELLFLAAVGASWDFVDWRGWALLPVFVVVRSVSAAVARLAVAGVAGCGGAAPQPWHLLPVGPMAIALVVSVQSLAGADSPRWLVSTVVGGAMLTDLLIRIRLDRRQDVR